MFTRPFGSMAYSNRPRKIMPPLTHLSPPLPTCWVFYRDPERCQANLVVNKGKTAAGGESRRNAVCRARRKGEKEGFRGGRKPGSVRGARGAAGRPFLYGARRRAP